MSKIVEIIGAPGVGKTTTYKALAKSWAKKEPWALSNEFLPRVHISDIHTPLKWLYLIRGLLGKRSFDQKKITKAAYKFLQENRAFSSLCWKLIDKNRTEDHLGVDNRFRSAYHVYRVMGIYQAITDSPDKRICITDELLTHRIIQLTDETLNQKELKEFANTLPLPEGIICLDAPVEILTKRSTERQRSIIRHQGRNSSGLAKVASLDRAKLLFLCKELEARGVLVLYVDASQNISGCVKAIIQHLLKINKTH